MSTSLSRMMTKLSQKVSSIHFLLLSIVLANFFVRLTTGVSFNYQFVFVLKLIVYISGIVLFFLSLTQRKGIAFYFSFYAITPVVIGLLWLFHGIFLALISSMLLFPLHPVAPVHKSDNVIVYDKFQGFMGPCCRYELTQEKYVIFEKAVGDMTTDHAIDFAGPKLEIVGDSLQIEGKENYRVGILKR